MKTTLDLPDDLLVEAKQLAAELGRPLRELVAEGLRDRLAKEARRSGTKRRRLRRVTVAGGLPPGLDLRNRASMHEWLQDPLSSPCDRALTDRPSPLASSLAMRHDGPPDERI